MFHVKHGIVACEANGICADAARAHKRVDTYGFHPLVNYPFPFRKHGENRRAATAAKRRTAVGLLLRGFRKRFAVHR